MLFGHGDDIYNAAGGVKINFSSNVWYGAGVEELWKHICVGLEAMTCYPEPDAGSLKRLIACQSGVGEENVIVTNGSITAFYLIAQAWQGTRSAIFYPAFSEYEDACRLYGHRLTFHPSSLLANFALPSLNEEDLCWICNPNNPDGRLMCRTRLLSLLDANPRTLFVIDQAYGAFVEEELLRPDDIYRHPNLILIQSISKEHKIPGLRIGYVIAASTITARINRFLIPWSVNAFAIEAVKYVLENPGQFTLPLQQWLSDTAAFRQALNRLDWLEAMPTATTFFLVRLRKGTSGALKQYLLDKHAILIRDAANFRGLDNTYIRLSTQRPEENLQLIQAISSQG